MLFELRIRIMGYANASNPFSVHQKFENSKMLRRKLWTSDVDVKKCSKRPGTLKIGFALKNYAQKWSQIIKMLDG